MKKTYIAPAVEIEHITVETMIATSPGATVDSTKTVNAANIEARDRGDYAPVEDDATFGNLW
ncbi:MAG: hypothetical protein IJV06_02810 [Bacteroidaceae bacterium]|nr:hypothetical protein [Bacteroidaceae bacterium]